MPARAFPTNFASVLRTAREVEATAETTGQWHAAVHANSRLLLAAVNAGWMVREVAEAMGLQAPAASNRIRAAREATKGQDLGVVVDPPPPPREQPPRPLDWLRTPVDQRDWLSNAEALALTGLS